MERDSASSVEPGPPGKTITASDGTQLHYPYLPDLGEKSQPPNATTREAHRQATTQPPSTPATSTVGSESWHERVTSAARSVVERAGTYGHAAVQALVLDDWKALTNVHSTPMQRVEGGADLASWAIPEGKVAEIAGYALVKVGEKAAAHLAAAGLEHTPEHVAAASVVGARWAARSENAKIAEQHATNSSTIWDRPLTDAENHGAFQNKDDMTAFLGPATEKGGPKREWHHLVESNTESRFGPERVHNIKNVGAIEKDPTHKEVSKASQSVDPELGLDADGKEQTLRNFLKGKSWERHVDEGERLLRQKGIDPELEFRAKTLERFEQRIELHDRLLGISNEKGAPKIAIPGVSTVTDGHASSQNGERSSHDAPRDVRISHWTPDMSHEDFAKLQSQIREGSSLRHEVSPLSVERDGHGGKAARWTPDMPHEDFAKVLSQIHGGSFSRREAPSLHVERDGNANAVAAGYTQQGRILSVDGDRIVQDVGRGHTATYSRKELEAHFSDSKAFDTMMQPGNYVNVTMSRNGVIDMQQQVPGHGWQSLGHQPLSHLQQSPSPGHSLGR